MILLVEDICVSIVVPVYNAEKYLTECLSSLLNQKHKNIEVICVNDASTDSSMAILEELAAKDSRIRLIDLQENHGQGYARNVGVEACHGEYIAFVDADDFVLPEFISNVVQMAVEHNADVISTGYVNYTWNDDFGRYESAGALNVVDEHMQLPADVKNRIESVLYYRLLLCIGGKIVRKEFVKKHKIKFHSIKGEDVLYSFLLVCFAENYILLADTNYMYRISSNSITHGSDIKKGREAYRSIFMCQKYLDEYLENIDVIKSDETYKNRIRYFFTETMFRCLFLPVINGLDIEVVLNEIRKVNRQHEVEYGVVIEFLLRQWLTAQGEEKESQEV